MDDILKEFLTESLEGLDQLDTKFVLLEQNPEDRDTLASIFRTVHTIKGTCGFLGFGHLEKLTHAGENLLSLLRDGKLQFSREIASALLNMLDAVRTMLGEVERTGGDGEESYADLIETLNRLKTGGASASAGSAASPVTIPAPEIPASPINEAPAGAHCEFLLAPAADVLLDAVEKTPPDAEATFSPASQPALDNLIFFGVPEPAPSVPEPAATAPMPTASAPQPPAEPISPPPERASPAPVAPSNGAPTIAESSIRVDVPLLDKLMNLVGELVLARNQILEYSTLQENVPLLAASQRLNLITSELQEGIMRTRMQPINNIWAKFPRVVRDLSVSCGKQVRVEMEGKETELDKSLIEAMKDPLTHLIRNAIDHGVELPAIRRADGKPEEGRLSMRAYHEGGQVHIEIGDDGAGINPGKLRNKALEKGLITAERALTMTDQDIRRLIFLPGFSTAEKITNISGRGVGMDVVKTNIEKIGGVIDLESELGHGTTFKIRIPLTLAIVPALIITSGKERFAIPQVNLLELIRINEEQRSTAIEYVHSNPVYRLRGKLLPIVHLNRELRLAPARATGVINIVVLQAGQHQFGLVVDQINDTQEIVVKPLDKVLQDIPVFAGATIMGDGRVALILDVLGIAQQAHILSESHDQGISAQLREARARAAERQTLLLVRSPGNSRLAIPLAPVSRLEEIPVDQVESAGDVDVVQYRGQILPLIHLRDILSERRSFNRLAEAGGAAADTNLLQAIVFGDGVRQVGLIVDEILDIIQDVFEVKGRATRNGVSGTLVIQGRVTELFDVDSFLRRVAPLLALVEEV
ncbi:CheA signal transduction histidine kinase [Candidatus Competibacter denitrificans Run_A_D11]|uniref:Chemotaxis protein CheA n=1 Tax=Candidatus Competibacter denitrificans Run_A_D11 TaxID=1400863 RepID=W6MD89_9GAMM|nr:chemotaxis protein CheA [Candidatus Competibacter denitrificans]CDI02558.1 CheA signal transduction histidine kinase [Candidatus Competibacter denitrificans Run_A_D11]HRC69546.1 chemotaxis protein CheA [Candidatus Competibacter denitrificans]